MNLTIYMSVIPGIIYGMALVELIRIYRHKSQYWETSLLGVFLFIAIITNRYQLFPVMEELYGNMFIFSLYMFSPIFFMQSCYMLTPDSEHEDLKEHFAKRRKSFFTYVTLFVLGNVIIEFVFGSQGMLLVRIIGVALFGVNIFIDDIRLRIATYAFMLFGLLTAYKDSLASLLE